jgi:hypothetical protein
MDENEVPERLGHLPGPKTGENGRKMRFCPDLFFFPEKILISRKQTAGPHMEEKTVPGYGGKHIWAY